MTRHHPSDPRTALLQHRWLNRLQTGLLVLTLVGIAAAAGRLPFGEGCLWLALFAVAGALLLEPVAASALSLRLYRVRALHPQQAHEMWALLRELPASAGLPAMPVPHYVPSAVVNAFATGSKQEASIALTDGLLRSLSPRELAGVFAHGVAHIANEDLRVMGLADSSVASRAYWPLWDRSRSCSACPRCWLARRRSIGLVYCYWPHRPNWPCSHSSACLACVSSTLTALRRN